MAQRKRKLKSNEAIMSLSRCGHGKWHASITENADADKAFGLTPAKCCKHHVIDFTTVVNLHMLRGALSALDPAHREAERAKIP